MISWTGGSEKNKAAVDESSEQKIRQDGEYMDWTEELRNRTGIAFKTTEPGEIEKASFSAIKEELGEKFIKSYPPEQLDILVRVIHTTADFSYKDTLAFRNGVLEAAKEALKNKLPIITDTSMAASGINKEAAGKLGIDVHCFIGDGEVAAKAKETGMTRSAVSVDRAAELYPDCIYAVGNAPTALMRLYELYEEGKIRPAFIVGVPVGFVNVVEAKELILSTDIPAIVNTGRKGGSNVAAAICNALLFRYLHPER